MFFGPLQWPSNDSGQAIEDPSTLHEQSPIQPDGLAETPLHQLLAGTSELDHDESECGYPEYREIQRMARSRHMSIAEGVRQALDLARRCEPLGDVGKKLEVIRVAARHDDPSGDIDRILMEIESGYGVGTQR